MRYLSLLLLSLLPASSVSAQEKKFSPQDFNKLKQLVNPSILLIPRQDGISELWSSDEDSLLSGTLYCEDSVKLPIAAMQLHYNRGKISIDHTYLDQNGAKGSVHSLVLQDIDSSSYYFVNTADITKRNLKEIHCSSVSYDLSWSNRIKVERKLILPVKGYVTVKYTFIKDQKKEKRAN